MKKVLVVSAFLALGTIAHGAQIFVDCALSQRSGPAPLADGTTDAICGSLVAPGGSTVNFVRLDWSYDITIGFGGGGGQIDFAHDVAGTDLDGFNNPGPTTVSNVNRPVTGFISLGPSATILAALLAGETIAVNTSNGSGNVTGATGDFLWTIDYTPPPPAIPEPSTYAMTAAGLVGFYMLRRNRGRFSFWGRLVR